MNGPSVKKNRCFRWMMIFTGCSGQKVEILGWMNKFNQIAMFFLLSRSLLPVGFGCFQFACFFSAFFLKFKFSRCDCSLNSIPACQGSFWDQQLVLAWRNWLNWLVLAWINHHQSIIKIIRTQGLKDYSDCSIRPYQGKMGGWWPFCTPVN